MQILNGNVVKEDIFKTFADLKVNKPFTIFASPEEASSIYVKNKIKACKLFNIDVDIVECPSDCHSFRSLISKKKLDHPFIIQEPFPLEDYKDYLMNDKNMDFNGGIIYQNKFSLPATVRGISLLLNYYDIPVKGKHVVIIGRSNIVGKPCLFHFLNRDATVTCLHSKSKNIKEICRTADILIVATGVPQMVTDEYINSNTVIIDVGIHKVNNKIVGDVDFESVKDKCKAITPVPGGVGPTTIAGLILNIIDYYNL